MCLDLTIAEGQRARLLHLNQGNFTKIHTSVLQEVTFIVNF